MHLMTCNSPDAAFLTTCLLHCSPLPHFHPPCYTKSLSFFLCFYILLLFSPILSYPHLHILLQSLHLIFLCSSLPFLQFLQILLILSFYLPFPPHFPSSPPVMSPQNHLFLPLTSLTFLASILNPSAHEPVTQSPRLPAMPTQPTVPIRFKML